MNDIESKIQIVYSQTLKGLGASNFVHEMTMRSYIRDRIDLSLFSRPTGRCTRVPLRSPAGVCGGYFKFLVVKAVDANIHPAHTTWSSQILSYNVRGAGLGAGIVGWRQIGGMNVSTIAIWHRKPSADVTYSHNAVRPRE